MAASESPKPYGREEIDTIYNLLFCDHSELFRTNDLQNGSALAILFLGERPQLYHAVGYVLVLTGVAVATTRSAAAKTA